MTLLRGRRILILLMLISFPAVSAILFTPALPEIARYFGVSDSMAGMTMSLFLVGYAIGQLPYAPIANRLGRKKTIYIGLLISLFGILFCSFAPSMGWLLAGRFLQSLGAAVGLQITFTMIGDCHTGSQATKAISLIMLALSVAPSLGVATGGFLTELFGWKSCFLFLIGYTILLALVCLSLPETAPRLDPEALALKKIKREYATQFSNLSLLFHALFSSFCTAVIYIFATKGPLIAINQMGLSPSTYGLFNLIPPIGLGIGQIISSRLAHVISIRRALFWGICIFSLGSLLMLSLFSLEWRFSWLLFALQAVVMVGTGWMFCNASAEGLSSSSEKAHAASVFQFINMGGAALCTYFVSSWIPQTTLALPLVYSGMAAFLILFWLALKPHHR